MPSLLQGHAHIKPVSPQHVLDDVIFAGSRPEIPHDFSTKFMDLASVITAGWDSEPPKRPSFSEILKMLRLANPRQQSVIDAMMRNMEKYAAGLEEKLNHRTAELMRVSTAMEAALRTTLPESIAARLSHGEKIEPEYFEQCTISFMDSVAFNKTIMGLSVAQVGKLFGDLYTGKAFFHDLA